MSLEIFSLLNLVLHDIFLRLYLYFKISLNELTKLKNLYRVLSKEEIKSIMSIAQGSWYECPRGHFYSVGECGRPMEASRCPECNSSIGGHDHIPLRGNRMIDDN